MKPLILLTNDDGIDSPGLTSLVRYLHNLGELVIAAPLYQQSSVGCSMPPNSSGRIIRRERTIGESEISFFGIDGSPVQAVQHGVLELAHRVPDLVISGINYGENIGASIIVSGTVGAALEASILGIPAIAVSLQVPEDLQLSHDENIDFSVAAQFTLKFAKMILEYGLPEKVGVLKIDVPDTATLDTEWKLTSVSKYKRYKLLPPERTEYDGIGRMRKVSTDCDYESNSDIKVLYQEKLVSVTPLLSNWTAHIDKLFDE